MEENEEIKETTETTETTEITEENEINNLTEESEPQPEPEPFVIPKIYKYSAITGEYIGETDADKDPEESKIKGEFVPLVPANATLKEPTEYGENEIPVFEAGEWITNADYRKNFVIINEKLNISEITTIGEVEGIKITKEFAEEIKQNPENYKIEGGEVVEKTEAEKKEELRSRLTLTAADVERAIYKAKGMDFNDLIEAVKNIPGTDVKALKIELNANNFYRNHPYISQIGALLGYTDEDLDYLFIHKELPPKPENELIPEDEIPF